MKNIQLLALILSIGLSISSCKQDTKKPRTMIQLEASMAPETSELFTQAMNIIKKVDKDPTNTENAKLLNQAATLFLKNKQTKRAAESLNKALRLYPTSKVQIENALLLISIFDNNFKESGNGDILKKSFIEAYPTHDKASFFRTDLSQNTQSISNDLEKLKASVSNNKGKINKKSAIDYITYAELYALLNYNKTNAPKYIDQAASIASSIGNYGKAIELHDWLINRYPTHELAPANMFKKAFILDENLNKKNEAKKIYEYFLKKYTKSKYRESVTFLLNNIEKTNEEILKDLGNKAQ